MWFKSKLQHPDPEVRRAHIEQVDFDDEVLTTVLHEDAHPDVRAAVLDRIRDLQRLQQISTDDSDAGIRNLANARLQQLVAGADSAVSVTARVAFLEACSNERLVRYVARSGTEPELRKIAITQLLQQAETPAVQDLLCDIAVGDSVQEIRAAAADPIRDEERLEKLLEQSRGRDKSIHRTARERLDEIKTRRDASAGLVDCCDEIRQFRSSEFSDDGKVEQLRLERLTVQWQEHADNAEAVDQQLLSRFNDARQEISERLAAMRDNAAQRARIMSDLGAHLDGDNAVAVSTLTRQWHELGAATPVQDREFEQLVQRVAAHDNRIERDQSRERACRELLEKMQHTASAETFLQQDLARFEKLWSSAKQPQDEAVAAELSATYASLSASMRSRLDKQAAALETDIASVTSLLDNYDTALEAGKLTEAVSLHDKAASLMTRLDLPEPRRKKLQERLRASEPRMAELKRWRHWGTDRKREELCEKAEGLVGSEAKIPEIARAVRQYREQWKLLDKADGPASKKLWGRFDKACEQAYEPCQALFEQQKAQRAESMQRRTAICEELETLAADTDWDAPPWRELSDAMKDIQQRWHKAGSVDRREKNKIQKRYDTATAAIDEHLDAMRQREVERREALIVQVEALVDESDTRRQTDRVRQAQRDWKPLVQAGRRKEQQLWKRFRAACDGVFEKRKERFAAADEERLQNLGEKLAVHGQVVEIIGQLTAQLEADSGERGLAAELRKKVTQLSSGWRRIGAVPRDKQNIDNDFRNSCEQVEKLCGQLEQRLRRKAIETLRDAAAMCTDLELQIATGGNVDSAAVDALRDNAAGNERLVARSKLIESAVAGDVAAIAAIESSLPENLATKRQLCLEMEIAANVDSPPEYSEERMQYRVTQLSESLSGNRKMLTPEELEQRWYFTGAIPAADHEELEQRFGRALKALSLK